MILLLLGFTITLISLLIGYSLGKHQQVVSPDVQKRINTIFKKVVTNPDVGPIARPTVQDNYYRDNPKAKIEDEVMSEALDKLNT